MFEGERQNDLNSVLTRDRNNQLDNNELHQDLTPLDVGYNLFLKYNGMFDPFREDSLTCSLVFSKTSKIINNASPPNQKPVGDPKSRFERLFDDRYEPNDNIADGQVVPGEYATNEGENITTK